MISRDRPLQPFPPGNGAVLLELLAELGVVPVLGQALHVEVGPVGLARAVVATDKVPNVHLKQKKAREYQKYEMVVGYIQAMSKQKKKKKKNYV